MRRFVSKIYRKLEKSSIYFRKLILITVDQIIIILSLLLSYLIDGSLKANLNYLPLNFLPILFIGLIIFILTGQYKVLTKYAYSVNIYQIAARNLAIVFFILIFNDIFFIRTINPNVLFSFCFISTGLVSLLRSILSWLIRLIQNENKSLENVIIYGAGAAGVQLASTIKLEKNYNIVCFIDDSKSLQGRTIYSIPIKSFDFLRENNLKVDKILLALPSINKNKRKEILSNLSEFSLPVAQIPTIKELLSGKAKITNLRPISIEELLGREVVSPNIELIKKGINNKNVCVTGAGGSIGSELCLQILDFKPKSLVLLDNSENNLYQIGNKLKYKNIDQTPISLKLGNAADDKLVGSIFKENQIDIVFHAAAYKHVPMVEDNPLQGISNNLLTTLAICEASVSNNLEQMILISTDKAVRPTNVMGASKRLAEQLVLEFSKNAKDEDLKIFPKTRFSLVRFGNVLGSSGSVIPLFEKQIKEGGPITITHKDINRFFMTLQEAAQLVLHVSGIAKGGEVFLLDMGKPVSIKYLAEQMIRLSGLTIKDDNNPNGDIEIIYMGLRPGEKLYEELLIDSSSEKTAHPLIFKGVNEKFNYENLPNEIFKLKRKIDSFNEEEVLKILSKLVPEWEYNSKFKKIFKKSSDKN